MKSHGSLHEQDRSEHVLNQHVILCLNLLISEPQERAIVVQLARLCLAVFGRNLSMVLLYPSETGDSGTQRRINDSSCGCQAFEEDGR
jgi:hypothetical protein